MPASLLPLPIGWRCPRVAIGGPAGGVVARGQDQDRCQAPCGGVGASIMSASGRVGRRLGVGGGASAVAAASSSRPSRRRSPEASGRPARYDHRAWGWGPGRHLVTLAPRWRAGSLAQQGALPRRASGTGAELHWDACRRHTARSGSRGSAPVDGTEAGATAPPPSRCLRRRRPYAGAWPARPLGRDRVLGHRSTHPALRFVRMMSSRAPSARDATRRYRGPRAARARAEDSRPPPPHLYPTPSLPTDDPGRRDRLPGVALCRPDSQSDEERPSAA